MALKSHLFFFSDILNRDLFGSQKLKAEGILSSSKNLKYRVGSSYTCVRGLLKDVRTFAVCLHQKSRDTPREI